MSRQILIVGVHRSSRARALRAGRRRSLVAEIAKAAGAVGPGLLHLPEGIAGAVREAAAGEVPLPGAREGAFDAALLIAIREKELGIPGERRSMAKARGNSVTPSPPGRARRRRADHRRHQSARSRAARAGDGPQSVRRSNPTIRNAAPSMPRRRPISPRSTSRCRSTASSRS